MHVFFFGCCVHNVWIYFYVEFRTMPNFKLVKLGIEHLEIRIFLCIDSKHTQASRNGILASRNGIYVIEVGCFILKTTSLIIQECLMDLFVHMLQAIALVWQICYPFACFKCVLFLVLIFVIFGRIVFFQPNFDYILNDACYFFFKYISVSQ